MHGKFHLSFLFYDSWELSSSEDILP